MAGREVEGAQHAVAPAHSLDPEPRRETRPSTRQSETERRRAVRGPRRATRPPVQVAHPRPSESRTGSCGKLTLYAYIVLSLLIGARTEELRALTWSHVD